MLVRHYSQDAARMCHVYVMGNGMAIQSTVRREVLPIYTNPFSSAETFFCGTPPLEDSAWIKVGGSENISTDSS